MQRFEIKDTFYLDGEPVKIISGAFHYFRTVPAYWQDRLEKLKAMGCNTVETYIPWNLHEPRKGEFCFEGILDVEKFIQQAGELGLYVIIRPSPYICAEWEFGGLPAWLLQEDGMRLRISYPPFLRHVEEYYKVLLPRITPWQITRGGPVILMQVENEYGYYANDKDYLETIKRYMIENGVEVPLVTSDGPYAESFNAGKVPGALPTGKFWVGWFDHWGNGGHMRGNLEESVMDLDKMLELGHVNIYMFEGGTNFGFMNGANYYDELTPDVTSYDYDGVLTEDGQITEKYRRYQEVIGKYVKLPQVQFSTKIVRKDYGVLKVRQKVSLNDTLAKISQPFSGIQPMSMERLGQNYGYILYRTRLHTEERLDKIRLWGAGDRANILVDDRPVLTLYDRELLVEREAGIPVSRNAKLDILVENMGRVNFGPRLELQRKGIDQCVQINGHMHNHWEQYPLPLDNIGMVDFSGEEEDGGNGALQEADALQGPAFYRFTFEAEEAGDTFLDFEGWGKGVAFVNGFNIGRFWEIGPQKRLYIPGPLLKTGENEIILFETEGKAAGTICLKGEPDIG